MWGYSAKGKLYNCYMRRKMLCMSHVRNFHLVCRCKNSYCKLKLKIKFPLLFNENKFISFFNKHKKTTTGFLIFLGGTERGQWYEMGELISFYFLFTPLTFLWRRSRSYRDQSIDFICKSNDWCLYDKDLRHERVKTNLINRRFFEFFRGYRKRAFTCNGSTFTIKKTMSRVCS